MTIQKETIYTKDLENKKIIVLRQFDAPVELVWRAWTESELLEKWWAPKPFKAITQSMQFSSGGKWRYYMEGPDGTRHYCLVGYEKIIPGKFFSGIDGFSDEQGTLLKEMPKMFWECTFTPQGQTTSVQVDLNFDSVDDLEKIVEMGFKEGFAMAHGNLDELLASLQ